MSQAQSSTIVAEQNRPPYDPELAVVLDAIPLPTTVTLDMVGDLRANPFSPPIDGLPARRGIPPEDPPFPGPGGGIVAPVLRPDGAIGARPGIYFLHGGGMIIGDRFTGVDELLDWTE